MVSVVFPTIDPVAGVDVAVIVIGFVAGMLRICASPMLVVLNVTSAVLAVQVTALVMSKLEPSE